MRKQQAYCTVKLLSRSAALFVILLFRVFNPSDALLPSNPASSVGQVKWRSQTSISSLYESKIIHGDQLADNSRMHRRGNAMVEYSNLVGKLKTTPRVGWQIRGVPDFESVADHSWRVAALCFLLPRDQFNIAKCIEMAVVHDMAEVIVGDITPEDNIPKDQKQTMELEAMHQIVSTLKRGMHLDENESDNDDNTSNEQQDSTQYLLDIFHEYEERSSKEATAVKDLDMLDMILQADDYEANHKIDMSDFFDGTPTDKFVTPVIQEAAQEVHRYRRQRIGAMEQAAAVMTPFESNGSSIEQEDDDTTASHAISMKDQEFAKSFAAGSDLSSDQVEEVVKALRGWENGASS